MQLGDIVKWTSHGGKTFKEKKGIIVAVIPSGQSRQKTIETLSNWYKFVPGLADLRKENIIRDHESYIVYSKSQNRLYHPSVKKLVLLSNIAQYPVKKNEMMHFSSIDIPDTPSSIGKFDTVSNDWVSSSTSDQVPAEEKPGWLRKVWRFLFG